MITLSEIDAEMAALVALLPQIEHLIPVVTEDHATNRLHDKVGECLVYTLPNYMQTGTPVAVTANHAIVIWILERPVADATQAEERALYERLQTRINALRELIIERSERGCSLWYRLQISALSIEPEYNVYGGFNGWAMMLSF